jgi:hypothetical protein
MHPAYFILKSAWAEDIEISQSLAGIGQGARHESVSLSSKEKVLF